MKLEFWFSLILVSSLMLGAFETAFFFNTFMMVFGFILWATSTITLILIERWE